MCSHQSDEGREQRARHPFRTRTHRWLPTTPATRTLTVDLNLPGTVRRTTQHPAYHPSLPPPATSCHLFSATIWKSFYATVIPCPPPLPPQVHHLPLPPCNHLSSPPSLCCHLPTPHCHPCPRSTFCWCCLWIWRSISVFSWKGKERIMSIQKNLQEMFVISKSYLWSRPFKNQREKQDVNFRNLIISK